jgi:hypothetical protein
MKGAATELVDDLPAGLLDLSESEDHDDRYGHLQKLVG